MLSGGLQQLDKNSAAVRPSAPNIAAKLPDAFAVFENRSMDLDFFMSFMGVELGG